MNSEIIKKKGEKDAEKNENREAGGQKNIKPRGRPHKARMIKELPKITQFSPRGRPGRPDEVQIALDQFEALKLADFCGVSQAQGAKAMGVSRATFGRILRAARRRMADGLVNGKTIKIFGGSIGNISDVYDKRGR